MKILIVMDPGIIIPVKGYGGIERIIEMLALEHSSKGHEVHLLITTGSSVKGCVVHEIGKEGFPPNKLDARRAVPIIWKFLWKHKNNFDLVHNFGRLIYLLPILKHPIKKIMSYQREINTVNIKRINRLNGKNLFFTGCSQNLINRAKVSGNWETVYNACDFAKYNLTQSVKADAPLFFLGRIEKIKGCHTAIKVAKATGHKLIIAGNISTLAEEKAYYEQEILPHVDGDQIRYIGAVNDQQKNEWLGKAKACLFPIEWNEPFGIVMIEAMACGTPVIAFNRGAVNEVVDETVTGFKVDTVADMISAVQKISTISRANCRHLAKERFDVQVIAKQYLHIVDKNRKKIVILSTHQPAANPRALKEYQALKDQGFAVKYLYAYNANWSYNIDEKKFEKGLLARQDFIEIGGNPHHLAFRYFVSRVLHWWLRVLAVRVPFFIEMSTTRTSPDLWRKAKRHRADIYIAHYLGALPAGVMAAKKYNSKLIFDAEDFHRGEQSYYKKQMENVIALENCLLPKVDIISTASPLITAAYKKLYPRQVIHTVNNVFSAKYLQPVKIQQNRTLRLFWFSQHIGMYRGLEVMISALNLLPEADISVTIMGNNRSLAYQQHLLSLSHKPQQLIFLEPVAPEAIFAIASDYDIGFAGEVPNCLNKEICLSNKIFTYLLAGNCILASDMQGQREFIEKFPGIGFIYRYDDSKDFASKIEALYYDRALLESCKRNARELAKKELNWENEKEKWLPLITNLLTN